MYSPCCMPREAVQEVSWTDRSCETFLNSPSRPGTTCALSPASKTNCPTVAPNLDPHPSAKSFQGGETGSPAEKRIVGIRGDEHAVEELEDPGEEEEEEEGIDELDAGRGRLGVVLPEGLQGVLQLGGGGGGGSG